MESVWLRNLRTKQKASVILKIFFVMKAGSKSFLVDDVLYT